MESSGKKGAVGPTESLRDLEAGKSKDELDEEKKQDAKEQWNAIFKVFGDIFDAAKTQNKTKFLQIFMDYKAFMIYVIVCVCFTVKLLMKLFEVTVLGSGTVGSMSTYYMALVVALWLSSVVFFAATGMSTSIAQFKFQNMELEKRIRDLKAEVSGLQKVSDIFGEQLQGFATLKTTMEAEAAKQNVNLDTYMGDVKKVFDNMAQNQKALDTTTLMKLFHEMEFRGDGEPGLDSEEFKTFCRRAPRHYSEWLPRDNEQRDKIFKQIAEQDHDGDHSLISANEMIKYIKKFEPGVDQHAATFS